MNGSAQPIPPEIGPGTVGSIVLDWRLEPGRLVVLDPPVSRDAMLTGYGRKGWAFVEPRQARAVAIMHPGRMLAALGLESISNPAPAYEGVPVYVHDGAF